MTTACNEKALLSLQCKRIKYIQSNNEQTYTCIYRYVKAYTCYGIIILHVIIIMHIL